MNSLKITDIKFKGELYKPYVNDHGIYAPVVYDNHVYDQCIMTKEMFVEAYNRWIKNDSENKYSCLFNSKDAADCWCE